ncbi:uncharacterized protein [Procambarus clarkii]|uniref:uncharacterized protein n=1 Tax=Procambarus clarkii TaxID=6728 RepID=UPI001E67759D|nr:uncharacterized protein LOC123765866 [Procambarus clarkii]
MYSHSSTSILQQTGRIQGVARPCCSDRALRITIYVLGALCLVCWACCIAATMANCGVASYTLYGSFISIPVDVGYIYVTCRIIFLISGSMTVTPEVLVDLQRLNARLVTFIVVGVSVFITGCVWYADKPPWYANYNAYEVFFITAFGFLLAVIVVGLSAGLHDQYQKQVAGTGLPVINESPQQYAPDQEIPLQQHIQRAPYAHSYPRYPPPPVPKPEAYYPSR